MAFLQEGVSIFREKDLSSRGQVFLIIFTVMTLVITEQIKLNVSLVNGYPARRTDLIVDSCLKMGHLWFQNID